MRLTRTLAVGGIAVALTVAGAAGASALQAPDGWSPARWMHQTTAVTQDAPGDGSGYGHGHGDGMREGGTGDPTTCPYAEDGAAGDQVRDRDRLREHDADGTGDQVRSRARVHAPS